MKKISVSLAMISLLFFSCNNIQQESRIKKNNHYLDDSKYGNQNSANSILLQQSNNSTNPDGGLSSANNQGSTVSLNNPDNSGLSNGNQATAQQPEPPKFADNCLTDLLDASGNKIPCQTWVSQEQQSISGRVVNYGRPWSMLNMGLEFIKDNNKITQDDAKQYARKFINTDFDTNSYYDYKTEDELKALIEELNILTRQDGKFEDKDGCEIILNGQPEVTCLGYFTLNDREISSYLIMGNVETFETRDTMIKDLLAKPNGITSAQFKTWYKEYAKLINKDSTPEN